MMLIFNYTNATKRIYRSAWGWSVQRHYIPCRWKMLKPPWAPTPLFRQPSLHKPRTQFHELKNITFSNISIYFQSQLSLPACYKCLDRLVMHSCIKQTTIASSSNCLLNKLLLFESVEARALISALEIRLSQLVRSHLKLHWAEMRFSINKNK